MEYNKEFIGLLNKVNQIFKTVYNSKDKFQNVWNCQNGKLIMHDLTQFPSYMEVTIDPELLLNAKGLPTAKSKAYTEFVEFLSTKNISIDSVQFFNYLKDIDKNDITDITLEDSELRFNNQLITIPYIEDNIGLSMHDSLSLLGSFESDDIAKTIVELKNTPFMLVLNFETEEIGIDTPITEDLSFLGIKIANKFLPYLVEGDDKKCKVNIDVYSTEEDAMYDVMFTVRQYKINKKLEVKEEPISIKYAIRVLEI